MKIMKHICFIIQRYANPVRPDASNFVQSLAWSMRDRGYRISIISPLPINLVPAYINVPYHMVEKTDKGNDVHCYYPKTFGLGQSHKILGWSPVHITTYFMRRAAEKVINSFNSKPDVLYGHFLAPSGIVVTQIGKKMSIPAFFACGESHDTIGQYGARQAKQVLKDTKGVIAVSTAVKDYLLVNNVIEPAKVVVYPNGYDSKRFAYIDKRTARKQLGLPNNKIIAIYVGTMNERKGILRVCEAINMLNGKVKLVCLGREEQKPFGNNVLLSTLVQPVEVAKYLYAADIFVLPTLAEGCSNAIIQALACGLPIISSNLPFNDDILNDKNSIRIDPNNISAISNAINKIASNENYREQMSQEAIITAKELTLECRTEKILTYIGML